MASKAARYGSDTMRSIEKQVLLQTIDQNWREHLVTLDHLRSVVGFRGYAQRDPLNEYKSEAFQLFETLLNKLRAEVTRMLAHVQVMTPEEQQAMIAQIQARAQAQAPQTAASPATTARRSGHPRLALAAAGTPPRASIRTIPRPGAVSAATIPVPAVRARNSSTATDGHKRLRHRSQRCETAPVSGMLPVGYAVPRPLNDPGEKSVINSRRERSQRREQVRHGLAADRPLHSPHSRGRCTARPGSIHESSDHLS